MSPISTETVRALAPRLPEDLAKVIAGFAFEPHPAAKLVKQLEFYEYCDYRDGHIQKVDRVESGCISDSWEVYPPFPAYFKITFFPRDPSWIFPGDRALTASTNVLSFGETDDDDM